MPSPNIRVYIPLLPISSRMEESPPPYAHTESSGLINPAHPLPNTAYAYILPVNTAGRRMTEFFMGCQASGLENGLENLEVCTSNSNVVGGLSGNQLCIAGMTGGSLALSMLCCALLLNDYANYFENPNVRLGAMCCADTCMLAHCFLCLTPAGAMVGAAAAGHTSSAAMTTAAASWAANAPAGLVGAYLFHKCCCPPPPENVSDAQTTRGEQYRSVIAAKQLRHRSTNA